MSAIHIYVEGGIAKGVPMSKKTNQHQSEMRRGFARLFTKVIQVETGQLQHPIVELCGGRDEAYKTFKKALPDPPGVLSILLVDAEDEVTVDDTRQHLKQRTGDKSWDFTGVAEEQCHLMVQTMEAWFLADHNALQAGFKQDFDAKKLKLTKNQNVEKVAKSAIMGKLESATNGKYTQRTKLEYGGRLLLNLDPAVLGRLKHCKKLFTTLKSYA